jgi:aryl-alcohol dehydrogenase-like predicted oxidoreductase
MEYRFLGGSGFRVPELTFGTGTFGGKGELFSAWGNNDVAEAKLVQICIDAVATMLDSADGYSDGRAEEILGKAIAGQRDNLGAVGWNLTSEQIKRLDAAIAVAPVYPYWLQKLFTERNPFPTP